MFWSFQNLTSWPTFLFAHACLPRGKTTCSMKGRAPVSAVHLHWVVCRDTLEGVEVYPFQGAQPMPRHCPPGGKCLPQWHL